MKVVNSEEMKQIDKLTISDYGIPSLVLMERAGLAVASKIKEFFPPKKVLIVAGRGNNGGDGLVVARILHNWGYRVKAIILANEEELSQDCKKQYEIARHFGFEIEFSQTPTERDLHEAIIVDAIFGTGLNKPINDSLLKIFSKINDSKMPVVAVDIPSGVSADTGEIFGNAIRATYTVTFGLPKRGHFLYPGAAFTGKLFIEDIGFDRKLLESKDLKVNLIEREMVSKILPPRERYSHKGDYGHVLVVAGSTGKTGAAIM
ncbi:MAG: NAD(P)H-hydrate epimerase, partial [Thermodesulfovibrionales bacterium]|nr:NAD(P)H-hydrate epimerase [Thermodesulfovibrionales bacterium]